MNYGRYQVTAELGKGSMGVVYKAHDPQIDRPVALKILRPDRVTSEDFVRRFLSEAKAIGRLSHPNIVTVYDVGQDHGTVYIAMEFLEGRSLNEVFKEKTPDLKEIANIGSQVAEALEYAHQKGIVHRDIKPPNIILTPEGQVKVTDFGIARIEDPSGHQQTQAGEILGTPLYMSPEQVLGKPVDGRSDIYSLGVILYELTTGIRPFKGENLAAVFRAITSDKAKPPRSIKPSISSSLSSLILKCLDKMPSERFQNGSALASSLKSCLDADGPSLTMHQGKIGKSKLSGILKVVFPVMLVCIIGITFLFWPGGGDDKPGKEKKSSKGSLESVKKPNRSLPKDDSEKKVPTIAEPGVKKESIKTGETVGKKNIAKEPPKKVLPEKKEVKKAASLHPEPLKPKRSLPSEHVPTKNKINTPLKPDVLPENVKEKIPATKIQKPEPIKPDIPETLPKTKNADDDYQEIQKTALLSMDSKPSGANFYVDGELQGTTPLKIKLPMGKYELRLDLKNYYDWEARMNLDKEGEIPISIPLEPK